jgi:hypothetical protein
MPTLVNRCYLVVRMTYPYGRILGYLGREFSTILTGKIYHFTEAVNNTQASEKLNKLQRAPLEVLVVVSSLALRW